MHKLVSLLRPPDRCRFDVLGLGECSLDEVWRLPEDARLADATARWPGGKVPARSRDLLGGGQIATAMVACRRLGLRSAFVGAVGSDDAGRTVTDGLRDEGVDTSAIRVLGEARTRCALILVDGQGERTVFDLRDPRLSLRPGEPFPEEVARARVLHLDATHLAAALLATSHARRCQTVISIDVDRVAPGVEHLIAQADLCVVPRRFPADFTGEQDFERATLTLSRRTHGLLVVTMGEDGCVAVSRPGEQLVYCPAFPVARAVDTTACGDTFRAALIAYLLQATGERTLPGALRFANAAAALKCRALGRRGCPTRIEVDGLLQAPPT